MDDNVFTLALALVAMVGLVTLGKKVTRLQKDVALLADGDAEAVKLRHKMLDDDD